MIKRKNSHLDDIEVDKDENNWKCLSTYHHTNELGHYDWVLDSSFLCRNRDNHLVFAYCIDYKLDISIHLAHSSSF